MLEGWHAGHVTTICRTNNCIPCTMSISRCFGCLDELTQVIYQSVHRFVILSSVTDDEWSVHVGLADADGRWWRGSWSEDDVKRTLVRERSPGLYFLR